MVPVQYAARYVYHFSHIDNLPSLIRDGFLATNHPDFPMRHRSIAASSIQQRRATMKVTCGAGGCVHDYVPLYFGSCSPMLLNVLHKKNIDQCDILYFEFPISLASLPGSVFTDASANTKIPPNFYSDENSLSHLDWEAIDSLKWGNPNEDYKHRRMAELLVHHHLPVTSAARCVVWNADTRERVEEIVGDLAFPKIEYESRARRHYFTNLELRDNSSLVIGPREIAEEYANSCEEVVRYVTQGRPAASAEFDDEFSLLEELREDFGCIYQTAELVGLKSANGVHRQTVDLHTKNVVEHLLQSSEYKKLDSTSKRVVELAAYLHDIGKGPKSRWVDNGGIQKVDPNHPVGAMSMMVDILTKKIRKVDLSNAFILMKLVCYHDLVGDVLGRDRDESQICDVASNEAELDMLFAIGKADVTSLVEQWWDQGAADQLYVRCLKVILAGK